MKQERKTEIKVGVTIVLALLGLLWVIGWAKNWSVNSDRKLCTVRFQTVSGLEVGDQVTINGVRKGYVDKILSDKNTVLVTVSLDKDVHISKTASFHVEMLDLMGGKKIEILPGDSQEQLDYSQIAQGEFSFDIPSVMRTVGEMSKDLPQMMSDLKSTLSQLNKFIGDEEMKANLKATLGQLKDASIALNQFIDKNSGKMSSIISNTNDVVGESKQFLQKNSAELEKTLQNIQKITANADQLLSRFDNMVTETREKKNNLGKMMYDDSLATDTKELLKQLNETIKTLNTQLNNEGVNVRAKLKIF
ncbi:MAG: MlaD family protein [Ignavibacteria bacterium]|nr:MlaD family protein [Ignavibacteria bacterium]